MGSEIHFGKGASSEHLPPSCRLCPQASGSSCRWVCRDPRPCGLRCGERKLKPVSPAALWFVYSVRRLDLTWNEILRCSVQLFFDTPRALKLFNFKLPKPEFYNETVVFGKCLATDQTSQHRGLKLWSFSVVPCSLPRNYPYDEVCCSRICHRPSGRLPL